MKWPVCAYSGRTSITFGPIEELAEQSTFLELCYLLLNGELPSQGWTVPEEVPVVVNRRMADAFWPDTDPVGRSLGLDLDPPVPLRIVAVVDNVLDDGFAASPEPTFFLPWAVNPQWWMDVLVRTSRDPNEIADASIGAVIAVILVLARRLSAEAA